MQNYPLSHERIPEELAPEVFEVASRLYAKHQTSYSQQDLIEAGSDVQIPAEFVQEALRQVQERRIQEQREHEQALERRKKLQWGAIAAAVVVIGWTGLTYNALSDSMQEVDANWAQVENQFQRRADLIPNLVNVTRSASQQEQQLAQTLTQARQSYLTADTQEEQVEAADRLNQAITVFQTSSLQNPTLRSSEVYLGLQDELAGTENRIAVERKRYNEAVQAYNQKVGSFPNSLIANFFGFQPKPYFSATNANVPRVNP